MNLKEWKGGVNLLGPGRRLMKERIYRAAVSQRLRNTALDHVHGNSGYTNAPLCYKGIACLVMCDARCLDWSLSILFGLFVRK